MIASTGQRQLIAYCECGTRLAGGSLRELFDAADRHIARHHPHWLPEHRASSLSALAPNWEPTGLVGEGVGQLGGDEPSAGRTARL
jgi:hypothetical protein